MNKKYFFLGVISLVTFGLLLPQPIQAILIYSPLKTIFNNHLIVLCIIVGIIQAISEECGYYFVMKNVYKKDHNKFLPKWFGLGRGIFHTVFDIGSSIVLISSFGSGLLLIISRLISLYANELKLLNFSDSLFVLIYSCTVIAVSNVLIKKCNFKGVIL